MNYLLFPALKLLHEEVIPFRDLSELGVHTPFEVNKILPRFKGIPGVLVSLPHYFIKMSHRHLSHEGLLHTPAKYGFNASISSL
jgi:hypothetical protein